MSLNEFVESVHGSCPYRRLVEDEIGVSLTQTNSDLSLKIHRETPWVRAPPVVTGFCQLMIGDLFDCHTCESRQFLNIVTRIAVVAGEEAWSSPCLPSALAPTLTNGYNRMTLDLWDIGFPDLGLALSLGVEFLDLAYGCVQPGAWLPLLRAVCEAHQGLGLLKREHGDLRVIAPDPVFTVRFDQVLVAGAFLPWHSYCPFLADDAASGQAR